MPLSVAAAVTLIRRYAQADEETRRRLAATLGPAQTALANQYAAARVFVRAAQESREATPEESQAFACLTLREGVSQPVWEHWDKTLPQRVVVYSEHFEEVFAWLDEWPSIAEHLNLMQLKVDLSDTMMIGDGIERLASTLGITIRSRSRQNRNRPLTDEIVDLRLESVTNWIQRWSTIETRIYQLMPEVNGEVVSALGGLIATTPELLAAGIDLHRTLRDMKPTPPTA